MPLGYLGYAKIADTYLLCNSTGLNRQINPLVSEAVWGAGWYNAAAVTNYADSQQHFEGGINFQLQGSPSVWNLLRDWAIENRVESQSAELSPNGIIKYSYTKNNLDPRTGVWLSQASFEINSESLLEVSATCIALLRTESDAGQSYKQIRVGPGLPTYPLNPSPKNRNPIPGWNSQTTITWPGAPTSWSEQNLTGMVLRSASVDLNNNTQIIRGCTGSATAIAVLQGTMEVSGSIVVWRDGGIPDPYGNGAFSAQNASIAFSLGGSPSLDFSINYVLLNSDAYDVTGQNDPSTRTFGFAGLGDGTAPPLLMSAA